MSDSPNVQIKVTDAISVAYQGTKVHLQLHVHVDEGRTFLSHGTLLAPPDAHRLGLALVEAALLHGEMSVA